MTREKTQAGLPWSLPLQKEEFIPDGESFFLIFDFKKRCDLEIQVRGHSMSLEVVPFDRLLMVSY